MRDHLRLAGTRLAILALAAVVTAASQAPATVRTVPAIDLNRYVGTWFEVARLPNRFQKDCARDVQASYERRADGRLNVINRCETAAGRVIEARGLARVVDGSGSARLKVRFAPAALSFLPFVWGDYWIIGLETDYRWAVVGSPDRQYLWILSRTPMIAPESLAAATAIARENGFDTHRLMSSGQAGLRPDAAR